MTAKPLTVTLETKLSKVMEFVDERHIQHFPVVEDERFAGMLSEHDLHDAMPSVLTVDDPKARRNYLEVAQVLPKHPRTVSPDAPLAEFIRTMRAHRIGGIAVTEGARLVGILTSGDLITLLERILRSSEGWKQGA